jgi:hypothetical protein
MPQDETASSSLACNICNERRVESEEVVAKIEKVFDLSGESTYTNDHFLKSFRPSRKWRLVCKMAHFKSSYDP